MTTEANYTLITDDNDYAYKGVTFMPQSGGAVLVEFWAIYHGDCESGPYAGRGQEHTMPVAEARELWRELRSEGARRE